MMISKSIKLYLLSACMILAGITGFAAIYPASANAQDFKGNLCGGASLKLSEADCNGPCAERENSGDANSKCVRYQSAGAETTLNRLIETIVNVLTTIVGVLAVIFIIVAGFKYITSGGDSGKITSARNTIVYAIIGLIIVALAQVIVRFVLNKASA